MTAAATSGREGELPRPGSFHDVSGWFYNTDVILFDWFLTHQADRAERGDLLEMGAYMGKSAVLMAAYLRPDETFTVCDLFGLEAPDERNTREAHGSYATLSRRAFEANFLSFHDALPRIIQAPTSAVPGEVADGSCRFVHVDASHLYAHVRPDIAAARRALAGDGLVVLDDFRSGHTPGVACATWQAVLRDGLRPVCVSSHKFYGTWGDPEAVQGALYSALQQRGDFWLQWQKVAGHPLLLTGGGKATPPALPRSRHGPRRAARSATPATGSPRSGGPSARHGVRVPVTGPAGRSVSARARSVLRRVALAVLPPVLTNGIRRVRRARRTARAAR